MGENDGESGNYNNNSPPDATQKLDMDNPHYLFMPSAEVFGRTGIVCSTP